MPGTFRNHIEELNNIGHQPGCKDAELPIPLKVSDCTCYEEGLFNIGAVAAMTSEIELLEQQSSSHQKEAAKWALKENNKKDVACKHTAAYLKSHARALRALVAKITYGRGA